ncbi:hypothetical protein RA27_19350 [Ruegeria sp. ANG-R]|uniref:hypothetical protein n=1 Tax=Ruegeria sp. ANG-R TaxID=1577903 RepID=UPI00057EFFB9|nr:hypothetical protein [Ruegeria sp. ANG-R]KIC38586.1 hypothetical protein RA27_19350 [Ruegeria sp. ANG-R]
MKIIETVVLLNRGAFAASPQWAQIRDEIHDAITKAEWPVGSGAFTIYPESGKKSGQGNGVVPIKAMPMKVLKDNGWTLEYKWGVATKTGTTAKGRKKGARPGDIDAAKQFDQGLVVVEWETGNVSSSHRAINKMALGLVTQKCVAGVLIIPNMQLAQYLTDRVGNIEEIRPYIPLWENLSVAEGVLELVVIEQDGESTDVPRIPKGKDGRAKEAMLAALVNKG